MTMSYDLVTGLGFFAAGLLLLWREMLLTPKNNATFPCAPLVVRVAMWVGGCGSMGVGVLFVFHPGRAYAGEAAQVIALLAVMIALYHVIMLVNLFQERRPASVWRKRAKLEEASARATGRPVPAHLRNVA